jgi:ferritin-like metal-binding protein YciE
MIADAQAVEHYEIARYGTMIAWAEQLGMKDAVPLLQQTLDQEYNADRTLTEIAESSLNRQAAA